MSKAFQSIRSARRPRWFLAPCEKQLDQCAKHMAEFSTERISYLRAGKAAAKRKSRRDGRRRGAQRQKRDEAEAREERAANGRRMARKRTEQGSGCIIHLNIATCKWWFPLFAMFQMGNMYLLRSPVERWSERAKERVGKCSGSLGSRAWGGSPYRKRHLPKPKLLDGSEHTGFCFTAMWESLAPILTSRKTPATKLALVNSSERCATWIVLESYSYCLSLVSIPDLTSIMDFADLFCGEVV